MSHDKKTVAGTEPTRAPDLRRQPDVPLQRNHVPARLSSAVTLIDSGVGVTSTRKPATQCSSRSGDLSASLPRCIDGGNGIVGAGHSPHDRRVGNGSPGSIGARASASATRRRSPTQVATVSAPTRICHSPRSSSWARVRRANLTYSGSHDRHQ